MSLRNTQELRSYYEEHKDLPLTEWLEFYKVLRKPGKQGMVGLLRAKKDKSKVYVFKVSKYINNLITHESTILEGLASISSYCPNFVSWLGNTECKLDPFNKDSSNPFKLKSKYPVKEEMVLTEFLNKSHKFLSYIKTGKISENVLYSIVKQVLLAVVVAQKKKKFSHYDLHSNNVMIKKCDPDMVALYVIDEENQYCVPTLGYYPVIIDYGFSYIEDLEDGPLWPSMAHTDVGFVSDRFDWVADPKLFLVTVSDEINDERDSKTSRKFRRIVKNIFNKLDIDWESGWDNDDDESASGHILNLIETYNRPSQLFKKYDYYCIDILQSLIIMPMEENPYQDIGKNYSVFMTEWLKIEDMISNSYYNMYILKGIVDAVVKVRAAYIDPNYRNDAVATFSKLLYNRLAEVSQFCVPRGLNTEVLLCSLILLARDMEGVMYEFMEVRMKEKENEYEKLPVNSTEQIYAVIETNIPTTYTYSEDSQIVIIDSTTETYSTVLLSEEQAEEINQTYFLGRGTVLYDMLK